MQVVFGRGVVQLDQPTLHLPLEDLALSLSRIHRWNGHSPITVAQHSVMTSYLVRHFFAEALLHDAAEALLGDLITPLKALAPELRALEEKILERIFQSRGLIWPLPVEVNWVDTRLKATEGRDFFGLEPRVRPYPVSVQPWGPEYARERFLRRAAELGLK
jgi:hypothetical protein